MTDAQHPFPPSDVAALERAGIRLDAALRERRRLVDPPAALPSEAALGDADARLRTRAQAYEALLERLTGQPAGTIRDRLTG